MGKVITGKVGGAIGVPTVTSDNAGNASAWLSAYNADEQATTNKHEIQFRAYGLFATVVITNVATVAEIRVATGATEKVNERSGKTELVGGADKGQISKVRKVLLAYIGEKPEPTADDCAEALELAIAEHGSIFAAYTAVTGGDNEKAPTTWESTLENAVRKAYKAGASLDEIDEIVRKAFDQASGS